MQKAKTMKLLIRRCALVAFIGSCMLLAASLGSVGRQTEDRALYFKQNPLVVSGFLQPQKKYDVEVQVINSSAEPARLTGSRDYCGASCFASRWLPITIPSMGVASIRVQIDAGAAGPLDGAVLFYTDRATQPSLLLKIDGNVLEHDSNESANHEPGS
jgi:hypothetical protein